MSSVVVLRYGVYGYALSAAAALLIASLVGLYLMRDQFLGGRVSWKLARSMLGYGAPYVVFSMLVMLLLHVDRLVLSWRASAADIGVYWIAIRYVSLLQITLEGFRIAWWPFAFSSYSASGDSGLFGRALSAYVVGAGCFVIGLYSLSGIGTASWRVKPTRRLWSTYFRCCWRSSCAGLQLVGVGIALSGRSFWAPVGTLSGVVVALGMILALWPTLGVLSAAWGIVGGELTALVLLAIISQRFLPLRWQYKRALVLVGILLLYLGSLEAGVISVGPLQVSIFLLIYCVIGWYALKGTWPFKSKITGNATSSDGRESDRESN